MSSRADRSKQVKSGADANESRRRREEGGLSVRKNKREEGLAKRRQMREGADGAAAGGVEKAAAAFAPPPPSVAAGAAPGDGNALSTTDSSTSALLQQKTFAAKDIPKLNEAVRSTDPAVVLAATKGFRRVLSIEPNPPVLEVLAAEVMPIFIHFLSANDHQELQFEAAWALTNIASTDQTRVVVEAGAVPPMIQLLLSPNADVREQCAWCLGNVAGDGPELRNFVLAQGALQPLLQNLLQPASMSMLRNATWALSNMCRGKPQPELAAVAAGIPVIAQLLGQQEDKEVLMDASWAMSYLSDGDNDRVAAVVATGVVPRLVGLLSHHQASVVTPALRTIGNVVSGDDAQTQSVVDAGGLSAIKPLLGHAKKGIRKEACWALSNVAAGSRAQISSLLAEREMIDSVLERLASDEWDVRKEAAWVVSNVATGGTHEQVFQLVKNHRVVGPLCSLLDVQDSKVLLVALDALEALLKCDAKSSGLLQVPSLVDESDGLDKLEALQEHENQTVYTKSVALIETYFGAEEDDENDQGENLAPVSLDGSKFTFGVPAAAAPSCSTQLAIPPPAPVFGAATPFAAAPAPLAGSSGFNFTPAF